MKSYEERLPLIDAAIDELNGDLKNCYLYLPKDRYIARLIETGTYYSYPYPVTQTPNGFECVGTVDEFNQRKAERQNKPIWSDAPKWANWLAQDEDGVWCWYECRPFISDDEFNSDRRLRSDGFGEVIGNWQDTIEQCSEKTFEDIVINIDESRMNTDIWREKPNQQDMNNDWYEKGYHLEVGAKVDYEGTEVEVVARDQKLPQVCVRHADGQLSVLAVAWLKPLPAETDKLVEQAEKDIKSLSPELDRQVIRKMIDAGYRKIKPMSEDEFVKHADFRSLAGLYRAGCRFIEAD